MDAPLVIYVGPGESVERMVTVRAPNLSIPGDVQDPHLVGDQRPR